ncbi:hypothetical protein OYC64_000946 [Pagothenia borchgrevinki]|uniref:Uncharacterized protein n=1 Tax=Pagothenia borchgrevinki TaxID=8213 RepID=A0ABD2HEA4_PAGBO
MASENYGEMSGEDMCEYLREKGLGRWADAFKEKSVIKLRELNDGVLVGKGIYQPEDRQKILDSILKIWPAAPKHEDASVEMFDHLMKSNEDLQWMMRACGLKLPKDLVFIKEMIQPPAAQEEGQLPPGHQEQL